MTEEHNHNDYGVRVGDVYRARRGGMTFTVTEVDVERRQAFGRRNTSRRKQPIDLRNLTMRNRYTRIQTGGGS